MQRIDALTYRHNPEPQPSRADSSSAVEVVAQLYALIGSAYMPCEAADK
jgi:hypothetical protein